MLNPIPAADSVSRWAQLGIKLPKELTKAIATYEAVRWVEVERPYDLDITNVTRANAEDTIRALAAHIATSRPELLGEAKQRVVQLAARAVAATAADSVPDAIAQLTPEFDHRAAAYAVAVELLPDEITESALIEGGTQAITAYTDAKQHAEYLNSVSRWVCDTAHLGRPQTLRDLNVLAWTPNEPARPVGRSTYNTFNSALNALNPVFIAAVRQGIPFVINDSVNVNVAARAA